MFYLVTFLLYNILYSNTLHTYVIFICTINYKYPGNIEIENIEEMFPRYYVHGGGAYNSFM